MDRVDCLNKHWTVITERRSISCLLKMMLVHSRDKRMKEQTRTIQWKIDKWCGVVYDPFKFHNTNVKAANVCYTLELMAGCTSWLDVQYIDNTYDQIKKFEMNTKMIIFPFCMFLSVSIHVIRIQELFLFSRIFLVLLISRLICCTWIFLWLCFPISLECLLVRQCVRVRTCTPWSILMVYQLKNSFLLHLRFRHHSVFSWIAFINGT